MALTVLNVPCSLDWARNLSEGLLELRLEGGLVPCRLLQLLPDLGGYVITFVLHETLKSIMRRQVDF